jgi:peptidyl-Lys metalloendopeptidase
MAFSIRAPSFSFAAVLLVAACADPEPPGEATQPDEAAPRASSARGAALADVSLACAVRAVRKRLPSDPTVLEVTLTNTGDAQVSFDARNFPFAQPEREYFSIERGGVELAFYGLMVKLLPPSSQELTILRPGATLQAQYTVSTYFHLSEVGQYRAQLVRPSVEVLGAAGFTEAALACNDVTFSIEVPEPRPTPVVTAEPGGKPAISTAFQNCDATQQAAILKAENVVKWLIPIALGSKPGGRSQVAADSRFYEEWFGAFNAARGSKVFDNLQKIWVGVLGSGVDYQCHATAQNMCKGSLAWTVPILSDEIHLCPSFFAAGSGQWTTQVGILVHELSHMFALTRDIKYWPDNSLALADSDPDKAIKNADNYEYFMEDIYIGLAPRHDVHGDGRSDLVTNASGTGFVYPGQLNRSFGSYVASFGGTLNSALFDGTGPSTSWT